MKQILSVVLILLSSAISQAAPIEYTEKAVRFTYAGEKLVLTGQFAKWPYGKDALYIKEPKVIYRGTGYTPLYYSEAVICKAMGYTTYRGYYEADWGGFNYFRKFILIGNDKIQIERGTPQHNPLGSIICAFDHDSFVD